MNKAEKEIIVVHDKECMNCNRFFTCAGKPIDVKRCVNYKERNGK